MNMSYIAPITPFDQIQYANRTVEGARQGKGIKDVNEIQKANLNPKSEDEWSHGMSSQWPLQPDIRRQKKGKQAYREQDDSKEKAENKAKITGKGQRFNEFS